MRTTKGMRLPTIWKKCLEMWDWIVEQIKAGDTRSVAVLKNEWCYRNGWDLQYTCFFCDYAVRHSKCSMGYYCHVCPGRMIDVLFQCTRDAYFWSEKPIKFRAELHRLNKKRLVKGK